MQILEQPNGIQEAAENLKLIRETMDRSTRHSSLSGVAGLLIGAWAITGVVATFQLANGTPPGQMHPVRLLAVWAVVLVLSALTDFAFNKRRAITVGKRIVSPLGARMLQAAWPSFFSGFVVTILMVLSGNLDSLWGIWMLFYGIAISSVGLFSVRPVSILGAAFVIAGALTLIFLPPVLNLCMMAVSFGGFHIVYGLWTGIVRGDW
ncbi:MAG TPA: hypothetical protein VGK19_02815 [Capsulimonadaceae bacterium]|jgi:hypothetical protein